MARETQDLGPRPPIRPAVLGRLDAARYLGVGRTKFDELRASDAFPTFRIGGRVVVKVDDLDAYIEAQKANASYR